MSNTSYQQSLADTAAQLRKINQLFTENSLSEQQLEQLKEKLLELESVITESQGKRPFGHFNFAAAKTDTSDVLPFSPVSGRYNPVAPPVTMRFDATNNKVIGEVVCTKPYEGPPNMVHGAVISGIYDQILALSSVCAEKAGHTAFITVNFSKPTPLNQPLVFSAWVDKVEGRKVFVKAQCCFNNEVVTSAEGLCIEYQG
jgi:hypothetical protein